MKINPNLVKEIAQMANVANIVGGGISAFREKVKETKNGYLLEVSMPSLSPDAYRVRIQNNVLAIITALSVTSNIDSEEENMTQPALIRNFPIPNFIDVENIQARYEDGTLKIFAPFNHLGKDFEKEIDIRFF
jgi:HSP20 family molecular chaperone IbpA